MKKSITWTALLTLGLSTTVYLSPVQAAPEFSVESKNIHTRTEVLKGKAPAGSIIVLQADDTEEEDIQEVAHTKAKADGTYALEVPEEAFIGEDYYDFHETDNEDDYDEDYEEEQSIPNYFLEVVSVDDYTGDDDGMDDDWGAYNAHASSYGDDDVDDGGDEGDEPGEDEDEPGEDDGDSDDGSTDPVSYDIDPIDLTVRTFVPKSAVVDTKTMTRATRTVTGKVENKDVTVEAYVYHKSSKEWKQLGKAKPRSNGSYKMTINKKLYKKDASIAFYVVGNRDADGYSKPVKRKYK